MGRLFAEIEPRIHEYFARVSGDTTVHQPFGSVEDAAAAATSTSAHAHTLTNYLITVLPSRESREHGERQALSEGIANAQAITAGMKCAMGALGKGLALAPDVQGVVIRFLVADMTGCLLNAWVALRRVFAEVPELKRLVRSA